MDKLRQFSMRKHIDEAMAANADNSNSKSYDVKMSEYAKALVLLNVNCH